jgi:hypothetical protein
MCFWCEEHNNNTTLEKTKTRQNRQSELYDIINKPQTAQVRYALESEETINKHTALVRETQNLWSFFFFFLTLKN